MLKISELFQPASSLNENHPPVKGKLPYVSSGVLKQIRPHHRTLTFQPCGQVRED